MTSEASTTSVEAAARVGSAVQSVISGKPETVRLAVTVLLAVAISSLRTCRRRQDDAREVLGPGPRLLGTRIQFTPDLLPATWWA